MHTAEATRSPSYVTKTNFVKPNNSNQMKLSELWDWLDDYERPTDTNWDIMLKTIFWVMFLAATIGCYLALFIVFYGD